MKSIVIAAALAWSGMVAGASAQDEASAVIAVPETVELAFIVAALSELDRERGGQIDRATPYFRAVEAHFRPFADMPAIADLPADFNLPRLAGNAADFAFDEDGRIVEVDRSGSLWGDTSGDRFRAMRDELERFAQASGFREFYAAHQPTYAAGINATAELIDLADMTRWLNDEFSARPGTARVYVSPLTQGLHWTTLYKPEQRIWIKAPDADEVENASALERMRYARTVFTEIDHAYVNPTTAAMPVADVEAAFGNIDHWADGEAVYYSSAALQFNEYMTWAVFLIYAQERLEPSDFEALYAGVTGLMVRNRGFIAFEALASEALQQRRTSGLTAEALMPVMLDWALAQTDIR